MRAALQEAYWGTRYWLSMAIWNLQGERFVIEHGRVQETSPEMRAVDPRYQLEFVTTDPIPTWKMEFFDSPKVTQVETHLYLDPKRHTINRVYLRRVFHGPREAKDEMGCGPVMVGEVYKYRLRRGWSGDPANMAIVLREARWLHPGHPNPFNPFARRHRGAAAG